MRILICASLVLSSVACDQVQQPSKPVAMVDPGPVAMVDPGPAPIADVIERPTTDGKLALKNLDAQIGVALDLLEQSPERPELTTQAIGLLLTRIQYSGNYADFGLIDRLSEQLIATHAEQAESWLTRADFLSATHRFAQAHAALDRAEALGAPLQDERRAIYWLATGENLSRVTAVREAALLKGETYKTLTNLAAVRAVQGAFEEADALYVRALTVYRDVSPLPVAWISFQRGVMWSEMANTPAWGKVMYQEAVRRLPTYVVANVHLAEIEYQEGEHERAIARLQRVAPLGFDPEPESRLASFMVTSAPEEASRFLKEARVGYDALLRDHEPAFRDHAAEFYLGAGNDAGRALSLALANLEERKIPRAYLIAIKAAQASGDAALLCSLYQRARDIRTNVNLEVLVAEVAGECK